MLLMNSLGAILWQILRAQPLSAAFDSTTIIEEFCKENDSVIRQLVGDCLAIQQKNRPKAIEIVQRFLDQYNDSCTKTEDQATYALLEKCRSMVSSYRRDEAEPRSADFKFSRADTDALLQFEDSWDDPGSPLRLAPQVNFLIGAGIFWDLIDVTQVQIRSVVVSRGTTSPEGNALLYLSS
jgi:hypothetical protein